MEGSQRMHCFFDNLKHWSEKCLFPFFVVMSLSSCGGSSSDGNQAMPQTSAPPLEAEQPISAVRVNQLGFLPSSPKLAVVPASSSTSFNVSDAQTDEVVFSGMLTTPANWLPSNENVSLADFSSLSEEGTYLVSVPGVETSRPFRVTQDSFLDAHDAALKAYYYNRASTGLTPQYAGEWARPLGHPDDNIQVHASAASTERPTGTIISAPKGWYDAGDFNKYVVNSGISTYTLLTSYAHHESFYQSRDGNIPESDNNVPDILDEVMWNLEWLQMMQDPNDGGVYHKLTTQEFAEAIMPHQATEQRYVVQKSTAAALNFSAVMAVASRIYADIPELDTRATEYRQAAVNAFNWALENPNVAYRQPADIQTGVYGDADFDDEFAWAAAELYILTNDADYLELFNNRAVEPSIPTWNDTASLGYISLLTEGQGLLTPEAHATLQNRLVALADEVVDLHQQSAYRTAMQSSDFVWGSNSVVFNKAIITIQAYRATSDLRYMDAAVGLVDYVLGKNPLGYSYITGFGTQSPSDPHHRQSFADTINVPVPGFLVGGPHRGMQDGCAYEGTEQATTYLDDFCSFSTNEVAINWNAGLVYVLAALSDSANTE
jgi:endoglucanase